MVEVNAYYAAAVLFILGAGALNIAVRGWVHTLMRLVLVAACFISAGYLLGLQA